MPSFTDGLIGYRGWGIHPWVLQHKFLFYNIVIITLVSTLHLLMKSPVRVRKRVPVQAGLTSVLIRAEPGSDGRTNGIVVVVISDRERVALEGTGHRFSCGKPTLTDGGRRGRAGSASVKDLGRPWTSRRTRPRRFTLLALLRTLAS